MYQDGELVIRPIEARDLPILWELTYKEENPEWKQWNAPYFPHETKTLETYLESAEKYIGCEDRRIIEVNGRIVGTLSYYWEHEPSNWLEMGILFYRSPNWGKGLGTRALKLWIDHLFSTMSVPRVGFVTWSGNYRMIRVGEKLGMTMEARIRNVRQYKEEYYDSIRMGLLREEWEAMKESGVWDNGAG